MAKIKKIITAGPLVKEVIYSAGNRCDGPAVRQGKKKITCEAMQRLNNIYSWQKLEFMLAANFCPGDLVVVLTYDDRHLPRDRAEAQQRCKYFRSKLSSSRRTRGQELVMIWNEEHYHANRDELQDGRWHHHCVINSTGEDYKELVKLWGQGDVLIRPLRVGKDENYTSLARYMCKEARDKPGQRSWSYTRNARKPEVETFRVPDDTTIAAPRGSILLEEASSKTDYGSYRYIKYLGQGHGWSAKLKVRRRRKN